MTYAQAYGLTKQANTQQTADSALQDAFNLGGRWEALSVEALQDL